MNWQQQVDGRWVSDSFEIELVAPKRWVMRRTDAAKVSVSADREEFWEGPSLRRLKAVAESAGETADLDRPVRRYLIIMWSAMFGVLAIFQFPGPIAATLVISLTAVFIWAMVKAIDEVVYRPWDQIREQVQ